MEIDEFETYINNGKQNNLNLLEFWEKHEMDFPKLALLARKILCIPSSSASAERAFSKLNRIITDSRFNLSSKRVESLLIGSALKTFE